MKEKLFSFERKCAATSMRKRTLKFANGLTLETSAVVQCLSLYDGNLTLIANELAARRREAGEEAAF